MIKTKITALLLTLVMLLSLAACNDQNADKTDAASTEFGIASLGAEEPVEEYYEQWSGEGGYFTYEAIEVEGYIDSYSMVSYGTDFYYGTSAYEDDGYQFDHYNLNSLEGVLYTSTDDSVSAAAVSDEGIWFVSVHVTETSRKECTLILTSGEGEILREIELSALSPNLFVRELACLGNCLYLLCDEGLIVLTPEGELVCVVSVDGLGMQDFRLIYGNDGQLYVADRPQGESMQIESTWVPTYKDFLNVYSINVDNKSLELQLTFDQGQISDGDDNYLFTVTNKTGLYGLDADGSMTAIIIWRECGITFLDLAARVFPLSDGRYVLSCADLGMLTPGDGSRVRKKTELVIAGVSDNNLIKSIVAKYNAGNGAYLISFVDYSEGGEISADQAIMRLNTEVISGKQPDMLVFSSEGYYDTPVISPYTYISKGYLVDMTEFFEADPDIGLEDISIAAALETDGGIYFLGNSFKIETFAGLSSIFGDSYGWTFDKYLELEASIPENTNMIYNITKELFLRQMSARYLATAIDWEAGTCDFNNDEFIAILEASGRIKDTPEDVENMDFTLGEVKVANGSQITVNIWTKFVWELVLSEKLAGKPLSFVGWPTVDGSVGSDIILNSPIGIISQSPHIDGCWEFIKFMLTEVDAVNLPVYKPALEELMALEKSQPRTYMNINVEMTDEDEVRFWGLLDAIENVAIYDQFALQIIEEEGAKFLYGDKTAKQTAEAIQSRMRIYVAEQS